MNDLNTAISLAVGSFILPSSRNEPTNTANTATIAVVPLIICSAFRTPNFLIAEATIVTTIPIPIMLVIIFPLSASSFVNLSLDLLITVIAPTIAAKTTPNATTPAANSLGSISPIFLIVPANIVIATPIASIVDASLALPRFLNFNLSSCLTDMFMAARAIAKAANPLTVSCMLMPSITFSDTASINNDVATLTSISALAFAWNASSVSPKLVNRVSNIFLYLGASLNTSVTAVTILTILLTATPPPTKNPPPRISVREILPIASLSFTNLSSAKSLNDFRVSPILSNTEDTRSILATSTPSNGLAKFSFSIVGRCSANPPRPFFRPPLRKSMTRSSLSPNHSNVLPIVSMTFSTLSPSRIISAKEDVRSTNLLSNSPMAGIRLSGISFENAPPSLVSRSNPPLIISKNDVNVFLTLATLASLIIRFSEKFLKLSETLT